MNQAKIIEVLEAMTNTLDKQVELTKLLREKVNALERKIKFLEIFVKIPEGVIRELPKGGGEDDR